MMLNMKYIAVMNLKLFIKLMVQRKITFLKPVLSGKINFLAKLQMNFFVNETICN